MPQPGPGASDTLPAASEAWGSAPARAPRVVGKLVKQMGKQRFWF